MLNSGGLSWFTIQPSQGRVNVPPAFTGRRLIRVLVADDHPVVRMGLRRIISEPEGLLVVAEVGDGRRLLDEALRIDADVVVMDLSMPGVDGLDLIKQLRRARPRLPVLVLSMHAEEQFAVRAIKAGAAGYLTKESAPDELVRAIRKVAAGGRHISPWLAETLAAELGREGPRRPHERLSDREYQVFRMIAAGHSTRDIAERLSLSVKTIGTYRARLLEKMAMKGPAEIAAYVVRHRLAD